MSNVVKGLNIYLIGMMGAGKSTVGRLIANQLDYHFFDTDGLISQVAGQSINEIFATAGEEGFRDLETQVISELCAYKNLVVATGGGLIIRQKNWSYLQHGVVVWLDVPVEQLYARLQEDTTRPLLRDPDPLGKLKRLLSDRLNMYAQADLHIQVDSHETADELAARILQEIPQAFKSENQNGKLS
ncbi:MULTISPECIES: shikimate kinase [Planktothricoides]|uniref:Shikimate kinase n=2 Tax=Planktothricoides raciborskii TaxID=132608 RepID=A0AAU8J5T1_9CYAN|nr:MULTISPECIES: shikimate kinase [Planktothricoides]KOR38290.1 shikimate kinase [Planktothricoides sp. SR001]MBD2543346.1 shikimate kinase [Planktothricoides raciborskii FACHB-1370]MBD2581646.1 shikimate kinase [Planktothricoides raciborskii FACHB-1261]